MSPVTHTDREPATNATQSPIRRLPPHVVNRIAAGEVVERPAAAVKELVENAIDAGATQIEIATNIDGRQIRVADNGSGIQKKDLPLAFENHATSKITDDKDLAALQTLGFRGEALASIAAISKLTCSTKTKQDTAGAKLTFDEAHQPVITPTGCAEGTTIELTDLFYNTPARLKFLKRPKTETNHIEELVQNLALSHPEIRFSLSVNDRNVLKTTGSHDIKTTIDEVFKSKETAGDLLPVKFGDTKTGYQLSGFVSSPGVSRSSKRWVVPFLNGRFVRCPVLMKAITAAYDSLLEHQRYPLAVLFLDIPLEEVDVNVHPTKREVRYSSNNTMFSFVKQGIRKALEEAGHDPYAQFNSATPVTSSSHWHPSSFSGGWSNQPTPPVGSGFQNTASNTAQPAMDFYQPTPQPTVPGTPQQTLDVGEQKRFKVIGQLFNTYILIETPQGLMVVDQHIASERTVFELLTRNTQTESPNTQQLLTSEAIAISNTQVELLKEQQSQFNVLGFDYSLDAKNSTATLRQVPLIFKQANPNDLFTSLLQQLEETGEMTLDLDNIIATMACHTAIRAGDVLTAEQMHTTVDQWLACTLPWTCPHGRPIAHTIPKEELNKFFHRPSLPANAGV